MSTTPEKESVRYMTYDDYTYLSNRCRDIEKKLSLLLAILVEKKVMSDKMASIIKFGESKEEKKVVNPKVLEWYESKAKLWMQKAVKKKGALRSALGIKEGEKIPKSLLQQIAKAEVGTKVSYGGKSITVTAQLKKRAVLAITFSKAKKK